MEGAQKMTTYTPTPLEKGEASEANQKADHTAAGAHREQIPSETSRLRSQRAAHVFVFVSGLILGAVATTAASILRRRQMPFVLGNRNVFVSLPFSGIVMSAPAVRSKVRGRGPKAWAARSTRSDRREHTR